MGGLRYFRRPGETGEEDCHMAEKEPVENTTNSEGGLAPLVSGDHADYRKDVGTLVLVIETKGKDTKRVKRMLEVFRTGLDAEQLAWGWYGPFATDDIDAEIIRAFAEHYEGMNDSVDEGGTEKRRMILDGSRDIAVDARMLADAIEERRMAGVRVGKLRQEIESKAVIRALNKRVAAS